MRRSGGVAGRPLGHLSIDQLEAHARASAKDGEELLIIKNELGFRKSRRADDLKDLVARLLRNPMG